MSPPPQELEDTVVEFLERGADVEADVLANIKTVLPVEAANMLSEIIPPAPSKQSSFVQADSDVVGPPQTYYREDVAASQIGERRREASTSCRAGRHECKRHAWCQACHACMHVPMRHHAMYMHMHRASDAACSAGTSPVSGPRAVFML